MLTKDSHNPDLQVQQKTQTTTIRDFTGGLNLSDPPLLLKENQLLEATNWQYSQTGDGLETRDPVLYNATITEGADVRATFLQPVDGVVFCVFGVKMYSFPSLLSEFEPGLLRCSDFTWLKFGVWNCALVDTYNSSTCDEYDGIVTYPGDIIYDQSYYVCTYIGDLTGGYEPIATLWGDSAPELLIASGGKLQLCRYGGTLETMEDSPDCTYVTKRDGRAMVNDLEYPSRLVFSGVGDASNWKADGEDEWTEADSIWIDVGYKSGGGISSVATLSKDTIVWKDNGCAFRITGSYPDWAVYEIGRNVWNMNPYCPLEAGGDLYFPDMFFGFSSIQTVIQYGEMRAGTVGYEVNKTVVSEMDQDVRMWNVSSRGEIWMKTRLGANYVYVYNLKHRAWTKFVFPFEVMGATSVGNWTYVSLAMEGGVTAYLMGFDHLKVYAESSGTDPYADISVGDSSDIIAFLRFPPLLAPTGRNLLKHLVTDIWGDAVLKGSEQPEEPEQPEEVPL